MASNQKLDQALSLLPYSASAISFYKFIADSKDNKSKLFQQIRNCRIDQAKCRFNVWRLLMGLIPIEAGVEQKIEALNNQRETYKIKKAQAFSVVINSPKKQTVIPKNPLMKAMVKAPKEPENDDEFLKDQIRKDVERTYQQIQFFMQPSVLKILSTILFVWCKRNPQVSYKQGMNEVIASIIYVYAQQAYMPTRAPEGFNELSQQKKKIYVLFNSLQFAQPDIYSIFQKIMNIQQYMYKTETDSNLKGVINPNSKNNTPILQRIITIVDQKLKALDIELFRTFKLQDVQTKTFLLRWIRCMHTREFSLENSFNIWDSIFLDFYQSSTQKEKGLFQFIDSVCVAMFVYMRSIALTRQSSYEILQTYQKYPNLQKGGYLEQLISLAWSLNDALKQPTSLSSADWVGQQNTKADTKIKLLKSKDSPLTKQQPKQQPKQKQQQKPKQVATKPKQNIIQVKQVKQTKVQKPETIAPVQIQAQRKNSGDQKEFATELNFNIVLEPAQWQSLVEKLQKSMALAADDESRRYIIQGIQILKSKVQAMAIGSQSINRD